MSFHPVATHVNDVAAAAVSRLRTGEETPLMYEDGARSAMVDFHRARPLTVEPELQIGAALQKMIGAGVRTLLVVVDGCMTGLITAYDIQGQKPLQFLRGSDCIHPKCQHQDIEVADIMTPVRALPTLRFEDVRNARIGDIVETFRKGPADPPAGHRSAGRSEYRNPRIDLANRDRTPAWYLAGRRICGANRAGDIHVHST